MADNTELGDYEWRYAGARLAKKGIAGQWIDHTGTVRLYAFKRGDRSNLAVGGVYTVRADADGTRAAVSGARFVRMVEDDDRARWIAEDRAATVTVAEEAAVTAAKRSEVGAIENMTLREARAFIAGGAWNQGAARLAIVLKALGAA